MAKFHHFGKNLKVICNSLRVNLVFGILLNLLWHILYTIWQIFIRIICQILKKYLPIWKFESFFDFLALISVWPDWVIYWPLTTFSKPFATINFPKSPTCIGYFCSEIILVNFYRHLAIFYWSHCLIFLMCKMMLGKSSLKPMKKRPWLAHFESHQS